MRHTASIFPFDLKCEDAFLAFPTRLFQILATEKYCTFNLRSFREQNTEFKTKWWFDKENPLNMDLNSGCGIIMITSHVSIWLIQLRF